MPRFVGGLVVIGCLLAAVPWTFVVEGTDLMFVLFALAPPLVLASGLGLRSLRQPNPV